MKKQEEKKLVKFLRDLYGKNWFFNWRGHSDGFELTLQVFNYEKTKKQKRLF